MNRRLMLGVLTGAASGDSSVQITDQNVLVAVVQSQTALAGYSLLNNGLAYRVASTFGAQAIANQWTNPSTVGVGANYECRAQLLAGVPGTINGSPLDTWLLLSTGRGWDIAEDAPGVVDQRRWD